MSNQECSREATVKKVKEGMCFSKGCEKDYHSLESETRANDLRVRRPSVLVTIEKGRLRTVAPPVSNPCISTTV